MPYYNNPNDYQFYQPNQPYQQYPPYYQNNQPYSQTPPPYYPREVEQSPKKMSGRDKAAALLLVFAVLAFFAAMGLMIYYYSVRWEIPYDAYSVWKSEVVISGAACSLLSMVLLNISLILKKNYAAAFIMIFLTLMFGGWLGIVGYALF